MTTKDIISLFETYKPKTVQELKNIGFSLKRIGSGAFRACYVINGSKAFVDNRVVVKIPIKQRNGFTDNLEHSQHEIYVVRKINKTKRYAALRPFMPVIMYSDYRNGIVVMPFYYAVRESKGCTVSKVICKVADALFNDENNNDRDISSWNIRQTKNGDMKIVDLGLI